MIPPTNRARGATIDTGPELRLVQPRMSIRQHVLEVWRYRELLTQLVRKELSVRYTRSILGFAWSMVNPLFMLAIYTIAFSILGQAFDSFGVWLLCGLLPWGFLSATLSASTQSITGNASLVGKVRFPREVLPLSTAGAALFHFVLQCLVFLTVLAILRHDVAWSYMPLLVPALVLLVLFAAAAAILLSSSNVYARDTQHLLELALVGWFWLTPIVYRYDLLTSKLAEWGLPTWLPLLNPITPVVITFQRALYGTSTITDNAGNPLTLVPEWNPLGYLTMLLVAILFSTIFLALAIRLFDRAEGNFAELM